MSVVTLTMIPAATPITAPTMASQVRLRFLIDPALFNECGSVEGGGPTAARTDPLRDRLRVRALLARTGLLAGPAGAQPHRPVSAGALLRLELGLLFRVRQVADILGKPPVRTYGYVFQAGSACMQGRWPVP
jgi:hypothetical protein